MRVDGNNYYTLPNILETPKSLCHKYMYNLIFIVLSYYHGNFNCVHFNYFSPMWKRVHPFGNLGKSFKKNKTIHVYLYTVNQSPFKPNQPRNNRTGPCMGMRDGDVSSPRSNESNKMLSLGKGKFGDFVILEVFLPSDMTTSRNNTTIRFLPRRN